MYDMEKSKIASGKSTQSRFLPFITLKTIQAVFSLLFLKQHRATETDGQKVNIILKVSFMIAITQFTSKKHVKIKIYFFRVVFINDGYLSSCIRTLV